MIFTKLPPRTEHTGAMTAVINAKCGDGGTTISCNIASTLAAAVPTCLVDLDFGGGDVAGLLNINTRHSINTIIDQLHDADAHLIEDSMCVMPSGLRVLPQPYDLSEVRTLTTPDTAALLNMLKPTADHLIIDADTTLQAPTLAALRLADVIMLVVTPNVLSIRDAVRKLELFDSLEIPFQRVHVVVNRTSPRAAVPPEDIPALLKVEPFAYLDQDPASAQLADERGQTICEVAPRSKLCGQLQALALKLDRTMHPHRDQAPRGTVLSEGPPPILPDREVRR